MILGIYFLAYVVVVVNKSIASFSGMLIFFWKEWYVNLIGETHKVCCFEAINQEKMHCYD